MEKIETSKAPKAVGPYSQAIRSGDLIFVSGQIPINPESGTLIDGDIAIQTRQILQNIQGILEDAGSGMEQVLRVEVFLKDLKNHFATMNDEYAKWFSQTTPPARQTVEVSDLPLESPIEISCIACVQ